MKMAYHEFLTATLDERRGTRSRLLEAFHSGNDAGEGYDPSSGEDPDIDPIDALEQMGATDRHTIHPDGTAAGLLGNTIVVVADLHGPWAVEVGTVERK